mgnify:FL=1|jgi:hypothetical protein
MKIINPQKKKRISFIWLDIIKILFIIGCVGTSIYLYVMHLPPAEPVAETGSAPAATPAAMPTVEATYITETCYDGSQELDPILYHYPFQKTDFYISNKKLVKQVDDDTIQKLQDDAVTFVSNYFEINADEFYRDYDNAIKEYQKLFVAGSSYYDINGNLLSTDIYTNDLVAAMCNSRWKSEVDFITDKSLIWQDNTYYVRGYLSIRTQKIEDSGDLLRFFPFEINKGQKIKAVIDIGLIPGIDNFQMTDINYIWLSEEE